MTRERSCSRPCPRSFGSLPTRGARQRSARGPGSVGRPARRGRPTRLDLAAWIVSRGNPLTARVFVNRLWKLYFGVGLAKNLDDFGKQGEAPVHPELLDWLADEFMRSGWDIKHIVRLIVTSQTYRQGSKGRPDLLSRDPYN